MTVPSQVANVASKNFGEIAILVQTFELSYLGTNLSNYGTFIYPIMVVQALLLQSWYICWYHNSKCALICNHSTFELLLWYLQQKTTIVLVVISIMVLTISLFSTPSTFPTENIPHNEGDSAPLAPFCLVKAPLMLHKQNAA